MLAPRIFAWVRQEHGNNLFRERDVRAAFGDTPVVRKAMRW